MYCSIIIPTRLRAGLFCQTLNSLAHQTDRDFEVVAVCDGRDSQTEALAASYHPAYPVTWVFNQQSVGAGEARNVGARRAKGDLLLFLDDDTTPCPEWVSLHRQCHLREIRTERLVVMGRLHHVYSRAPHSRIDSLLRESLANQDRLGISLKKIAEAATAEFWVGLNTSIRRDLYLACGQADPVLSAVEEDLEIAYRLVEQGFNFIYEPAAVIDHHESKDLVRDRLQRAPFFGISDVYRVREKGQLGARWPRLAALHCGPNLTRRWGNRFTWHFPRLAHAAGQLCRLVTDCSGSTSFFRLWGSLTFTATYWSAVRTQGMNLKSLRALVTAVPDRREECDLAAIAKASPSTSASRRRS